MTESRSGIILCARSAGFVPLWQGLRRSSARSVSRRGSSYCAAVGRTTILDCLPRFWWPMAEATSGALIAATPSGPAIRMTIAGPHCLVSRSRPRGWSCCLTYKKAPRARRACSRLLFIASCSTRSATEQGRTDIAPARPALECVSVCLRVGMSDMQALAGRKLLHLGAESDELDGPH